MTLPVAEIADAADISVTTLSTYIGSKEELLFSGRPNVLDAVVEAVRNRKLVQTPLVAAGQALLTAVDDRDQDRNTDAFLRMAGSGPAAGPGCAPCGTRPRTRSPRPWPPGRTATGSWPRDS